MIPRVSMYSPSKLWGFCQSLEGEFYFHASNFFRRVPGEPGPILGEPVLLDGEGSQRRVYRTRAPVMEVGRVRSFDSKRGWGFLELRGNLIFLHRSDLVFSFVPVIGSEVEFFLGERGGKPRACWAKPKRGEELE
jgi:cold shock CspA family protein